MNEWGPIQVIPPGLLGLLQLKNFGRSPDMLNSTYQAVIESRDWVLQARAQDSGLFTRALPTGADFFFFDTPTTLTPGNEEAWYVWDYTVRASAGAGDTISDLQPMYRMNGSPAAVVHVLGPQSISLAGSAAAPRAIVGAHNFWLQPGAELGFYGSFVAATTITFAGYLRYTPLPL